MDDAERLMDELSDLTLPLMWSLRQDAMRAFEPLQLRPVKALLLELVAQGMRRPKELAGVLDTVPPTISAMLRELTERGLIERDTDPEDRRRVHLRLTPEGERFRLELQQAWREVSRQRYGQLSPEELRTLLGVYHKLIG